MINAGLDIHAGVIEESEALRSQMLSLRFIPSGGNGPRLNSRFNVDKIACLFEL
jgi:hypothetical protein